MAGHRADGAVTPGRDHQAWLPLRPAQQLGQSIKVPDLELLRHDDCVLVEGATGTLELAAAARVRAYHQHGLCWHHWDISPDDRMSGHHTFCVIRRPGPRSTSSAGRPRWPSGDDHLKCVMTGHLRSDQAPPYD
jgi:hypothetical protein